MFIQSKWDKSELNRVRAHVFPWCFGFFFLLFLPSPLLRYYQRKPLCFVCAGKGGGRGQGRETWCFVLAILVNLIIEDFLKRVHVYLYVFIFFSQFEIFLAKTQRVLIFSPCGKLIIYLWDEIAVRRFMNWNPRALFLRERPHVCKSKKSKNGNYRPKDCTYKPFERYWFWNIINHCANRREEVAVWIKKHSKLTNQRTKL